MCFLVQRDCKCCQYASLVFDDILRKRNFDVNEFSEEDNLEIRKAQHHCKRCWDEFHNGQRDDDWEDLESFLKK